MQFPNKKILIIAGNNRIKKNSLIYFDETVLKFLSVLSKDILKNREAQKYADLVSFGFWIREKNLFKIKSDYNSDEIRFGHGLSFHITPSNIMASNNTEELIFLGIHRCTIRGVS